MKRAILYGSLVLFLLPFWGCDDDDELSDETHVNYGALGASDAFGVGAEPRENGYVWRVADWLEGRFDNVTLVNAGIPGVTADQIILLELGLVKELDPNVVTLWTGANDIMQGRSEAAFDSDLEEILDELDEEPGRVYIANVPDLTLLPIFQQDPDPDVTQARVASFNSIIVARAAQHGAFLVDLYATPLASDPSYIASDGLHPNNAGHRLIADTFIAVIAPTLPARARPGRLLAAPSSAGRINWR
jgi:lysophospholipase L1-like esterase